MQRGSGVLAGRWMRASGRKSETNCEFNEWSRKTEKTWNSELFCSLSRAMILIRHEFDIWIFTDKLCQCLRFGSGLIVSQNLTHSIQSWYRPASAAVHQISQWEEQENLVLNHFRAGIIAGRRLKIKMLANILRHLPSGLGFGERQCKAIVHDSYCVIPMAYGGSVPVSLDVAARAAHDHVGTGRRAGRLNLAIEEAASGMSEQDSETRAFRMLLRSWSPKAGELARSFGGQPVIQPSASISRSRNLPFVDERIETFRSELMDIDAGEKYATPCLSFLGLRITNSRMAFSKLIQFLNQSYVFSEKICL
jgi:hypothetical protein